jgi:uncharacterized membrane protein YeaQ/YmgE (transglycosylase-associated protein family)
MSVTDVIVFIVVGLIAGFSQVGSSSAGPGLAFDIIIGIVGALSVILAGLLHISINLGIPFLNQVIVVRRGCVPGLAARLRTQEIANRPSFSVP